MHRLLHVATKPPMSLTLPSFCGSLGTVDGGGVQFGPFPFERSHFHTKDKMSLGHLSRLICALWTGTVCFLSFGFIKVVNPPVNFLKVSMDIPVNRENQPRGFSRTCLEEMKGYLG